MTTAIGTYATLAGVQTRLTNTASVDVAEITKFCDQVNSWIETRTGRVIAPLPTVTSTLHAGVAIGATVVVAAAAADVAKLQVGDELAIGPVTGIHESSPVVDVSTTTVTLAVPLANAYLTGAPLERVYIRDGFDAAVSDDIVPGRVLVESRGVIKLTALEVATFTGGPFSTIPPTDYFLRPVAQRREPGWPATEINLTNIPSPTNSVPAFFPGWSNIREWGQMGWPAIPDDLTGLAERVVAALWQMKTSGGAYSVAPQTDMSQQIPHLLSSDDWRLMQHYTVKDIGVIG